MLLPHLCLLAGVKPRMNLLALAIPYAGNPKVRYYTVFSIGQYNINKASFVAYMLLPLLGLLAGVKPPMKLLALTIPCSGNPKGRYDTVLVLVLLT